MIMSPTGQTTTVQGAELKVPPTTAVPSTVSTTTTTASSAARATAPRRPPNNNPAANPPNAFRPENAKEAMEYYGVKEKLREHVEGLTKELYEQLVKKMFVTMEMSKPMNPAQLVNETQKTTRVLTKSLTECQVNLRGEMDALVDDLFVPFISQATAGAEVEPIELTDAKVKLRKCMDDIVRDLFGPFISELNDLFKNTQEIAASNGIGGSPAQDDDDDEFALDQMDLEYQKNMKRKLQIFHREMAAQIDKKPTNGDIDQETSQIMEQLGADIDSLNIGADLDQYPSFMPYSSIPDKFVQKYPADLKEARHDFYCALLSEFKGYDIEETDDEDEDEKKEEKEEVILDTPEAIEEDIRRFERTHLTGFAFNCKEDDCFILIDNEFQLNRHLIKRHNIMPHVCLVCNLEVDENLYGTLLTSHIYTAHMEQKGGYTCKRCLDNFKTHQQLTEHIHLCHTNSTISSTLKEVADRDDEHNDMTYQDACQLFLRQHEVARLMKADGDEGDDEAEDDSQDSSDDSSDP